MGGADGGLYIATDTGSTYLGKDDGTLLQLNDMSEYVKKSGDTMTGSLTGTNAKFDYITTPSFIGEGDTSTYYHRLDFGHAGTNSVNFYEFGGLYNFYRNEVGAKANSELIGSIKFGQGWTGKVNGHTINADVPADAKFTDTILEWGTV